MLALPTTLESLIKAADFLGKLGTAIIGEGYYLSFQQLPLVTRGLVLLDKWRLPSIKSNDIANFWSRIQAIIPHSQRAHQGALHYEGGAKRWMKKNSRRLMIGSVAPTCTYNECRGCKYKCRAEQVPVEGNDPMNSPYHYKCVCHR
ncbi:EPIDERMAL PATTERNING FACTOR-like protein 9 [Capsicum baccatum]|uniref:EPIDERMAL PATTERNING FACTOR-like protein 9 n=1 Tax=Capsicum baccatum TaxID=33114 RepID=A0A2G2WD44_CAPBA|nr:EPIDERMAL PATTERNING FACTOR-like protein 9 [Capsicum baccatum]